MVVYEETTHTFVVKIWLEEARAEAGRVAWRGHVTHVVSGERHYLQDLDALTDLLSSYLERMEVKPPWRLRLRRWLKGKKH